MKKVTLLLFLCYCLIPELLFCQGFNHTWLLSYDFSLISDKARINFTSNADTLLIEQRKILFRNSTQANISDSNGNFLMASNGVWIANASGDTMLNGSGLNPSAFTSSWSHGLPLPNGNLIFPWPDDTTKYVLFHQTGNGITTISSTELYYSIIDITLDGGLGEVIQKNLIAFQDTLNWGIGACKHANGRDWWIVALKDQSSIIYKFLFTPSGISSVTTQILNVPFQISNATQPTFSPDGTKFAYSYAHGGPTSYHDIRLFNFDRCTGNLSDTTLITFLNNGIAIGLAFSASSKYLYVASTMTIYQLNTDTFDIFSSLQTVAINDTFASPFPPFYTDFFQMYLAANGKIYLTSGSSVQALHYINYPDSGGLACEVHQHDIALPCWHQRAVPNHPNYYLGPVTGSVCDSLGNVGINETSSHDFHFSVSPNPISDGYMKMIYLLPQNRSGVLEVFDVNGRVVYKMPLSPWSTLQQVKLPQLANGIYSAVITSAGQKAGRKIAITDLID